jgi:hypothetical protein
VRIGEYCGYIGNIHLGVGVYLGIFGGRLGPYLLCICAKLSLRWMFVAMNMCGFIAAFVQAELFPCVVRTNHLHALVADMAILHGEHSGPMTKTC